MGIILDSDKLHALEFSMTIGCKLNCKYCPQDKLLGEYSKANNHTKYVFEFEDFKKCLDKVQPGAEISFCGMSEPFHNKQCADMVRYAYEKGFKISLLTTLIGMTRNDFEKIKDVEFDSFVLHIPDKENNSKFIIDQDYLELLKLVNENIKIDYYSCHGTVNEEVTDIIDKEKYAGIALGDRAGNLDIDGFNKIKREGKIICFHGSEAQVGGWAPVVLPDGTLILCCQDYGMDHVLGNLIEQSWSEIREGDEYQKFVRGMNDDTIPILCRSCGDARNIENLPSMKLKKLIDEKKKVATLKQEESSSGDLISKLAKAKNICIFGMGKLFRDHCIKYYWHEALNVSCFSDNNPNFWGESVNGIKVVSPNELLEYEDLLIITFMKNDKEVVLQLEKMGIKNCLKAETLFKFFSKRG
ncbi:radical SAM/SPASM domain-containing protein [Clostridium beijerinckii]|uniref:radical SAM/SPASM domain-containing protein n=1 Tax=Clostridium beijerinckii TaxID=1520 RepID=UPI00232A88D9|nr:radical SAM/SPASM domain-containing protein [Clostridium beijerinckii]